MIYEIDCIFTMFIISFISHNQITTRKGVRKMAIFLFGFYFWMHRLYNIPHVPNVLFFIFICFFYFSNLEPETRGRARHSDPKWRQLDVGPRVFFRDRLFEPGKVIFALSSWN